MFPIWGCCYKTYYLFICNNFGTSQIMGFLILFRNFDCFQDQMRYHGRLEICWEVVPDSCHTIFLKLVYWNKGNRTMLCWLNEGIGRIWMNSQVYDALKLWGFFMFDNDGYKRSVSLLKMISVVTELRMTYSVWSVLMQLVWWTIMLGEIV